MNTKKILISIIVPIYNADKYLNKCLDSILIQNAEDIEIILVDDGSSDSSAEICDEYINNYNNIQCIHKKNEGVLIARNEGVRISKGDYLVFIDADDWLENDYLSRIKKIINEVKPDVICFGLRSVFRGRITCTPFPLKHKMYTKKDITSTIFPYLIENPRGECFSNSLCDKVISKKLLCISLPIDKKIVMGEDAACVKPCIYKAEKIYVDNKSYYNYRRNDGSITISGKPLLWDGPALIAEHYNNTLDLSKYDFQAQVYRNVVHNLFNVAVSQFSKEGSYLSISKSIKKELLNPIYNESIKNARFTSLFGIICEFSIRHRICFIFYLRWLQKYGIKQMKKKNK